MARFQGPSNRPKGQAPEHQSVSQLELLSKCGVAFAFRYLDGIKVPPSLAMVKGTATHTAAQDNFRQKIESREDISVADFEEIAATTFEAETHSGVAYTPEEESVGIAKVKGAAKDRTVEMARGYHLEISPEYQPAIVEEEFTIPLPSAGTSIKGWIDLVDVKQRIVDHKTSGRAKNQADADASLQLTTYAAARTRAGFPPPEIRLETMVQTKAGNLKRQQLVTFRGAEDFSALAQRIIRAKQIIDLGAFLPAPVGAWWCSPKWCGYHSICPFVNHSKRISDE